MNEEQAKRQLKRMLRKFSPGSILHLLADLFREAAAEGKDVVRSKRVEEALYVVGLGIDAALPRDVGPR